MCIIYFSEKTCPSLQVSHPRKLLRDSKSDQTGKKNLPALPVYPVVRKLKRVTKRPPNKKPHKLRLKAINNRVAGRIVY